MPVPTIAEEYVLPSSSSGTSNQLISALPQKVCDDILRQCETVDLSFGDVLYEANQPIQFLYFPLSGFISMLIATDEDEPLGMGLIGYEGMFGSTLAIDIDKTTTQILVQGAGRSLRLTV